ncbi:MAG: hypothetical protein A3K60_03320 [Euryarchaeota archaeon RBG_19FT_COMBO_56_21]|nr:MAG: hypothetical protein A3K60_03320 [Euryarchaeota archaeon RBG_19FT_COMBO_56_21]
MKVGFVVNPIAGMGGAVGLKGTDGADILREAVARSAQKVSPYRAEAALRTIKSRGLEMEFVTCGGEMGMAELQSTGFEGRVVHVPGDPSSRVDTLNAAKAFLAEKVDLILFAGGDGTARDLLEIVDRAIPMVGIPGGVKMHSAVFALTPEAAAESIESFVQSGTTRQAEVMDVDEESFREGVLRAKLFGYARVPDNTTYMQSSKMTYHSGSVEDESEELGQYVAESFEQGIMYIVGPGSTTESIARHLGLRKTLLGVDVYLDGKVLAEDASEKTILELLERRGDARIVVSPIGSQGFILGRGNQQISPRVIRKVGACNIVVVSTPTKLRDTPMLRVDTGDRALDDSLKGRKKVLTGYKRKKLVAVE